VLFELAEVNRSRAPATAALLRALGRHAGRAAAGAARLPAGRRGGGLDEAAIQAQIAPACGGQGGARLCRSRPHPPELAAQGIELKDSATGHHLGAGLTMPKRPAPAPAADAAAAPAPAMPALMTRARHATITPAYWDEACRHLAKRDRVMKRLIPKFGEARLQSRGDAFTTLARSIVGQQISVKAAQSVWDRFAACCRRAEPPAGCRPRAGAGRLPTLRGAGLSARKAEYLHDLARHFASKARCTCAQWQQMDDEAIIEELVAIRGIGRWTAEMFLIFHLMRPNVLPLDDLGLLKGISLNYFSGEPVSRAEAREVGEAWAPFRSVATWYIWRSLDPLPVDY
jgi:DNA-3-methyladenine glycosylase II